jgi:NADH-quinone oxidoreductase subunit H
MNFDPVTVIKEWLEGLLLSWNLSAGLVDVILKLIGAVVIAGLVLLIFIILTWVERKVAARFQDRIGPNRVGPRGLLQPIADALKMVTKEDTTPSNADKIAYNMAPIMSVASVLLMWAVIPFSAFWMGTESDLNVGVLYIAAVGSFGILSVLMAGWSSNNKYALLGAFRGVAQLISYEVPLFLALLVPVLLARSMGLNAIVEAQAGGNWFIIYAPLAFVIYLVSSLAEVGRTPFDLLEAESEIVAGYHVEYSGMKFGLFQAGEFLHSFTAGALMSIFFFGGWQPVDNSPWLGTVVFFAKSFALYFIIMWSRSTLPRIRIDHMMALNWKFMVPISLVLLMITPLLDHFLEGTGYKLWAMLAFNLVLFFVAVGVAGRAVRKGRRPRVKFEGRPLAVPPKEDEAAA